MLITVHYLSCRERRISGLARSESSKKELFRLETLLNNYNILIVTNIKLKNNRMETVFKSTDVPIRRLLNHESDAYYKVMHDLFLSACTNDDRERKI